MGVNSDRIFNQDETAKNNDVARKQAISETTGVVDSSWDDKSNPFINDDGTVVDNDYQAMIEKLNAKKAVTTDKTELANIEAQLNYAKRARIKKIASNPAYAKYADTIEAPSATRTAAVRDADENRNVQYDSTEKNYNLGLDTNNKNYALGLDTNSKNLEGSKYQTDKSLEGTKYTTDAQERMNTANNSTSLQSARISASNKTSSSGGGENSLTGGTTAPTAAMKKEALNAYNTGGNEALNTWASAYDWSKYDISAIESYLSDYGNASGVGKPTETKLNKFIKDFNEHEMTDNGYTSEIIKSSGNGTYRLNMNSGNSSEVQRSLYAYIQDSDFSDNEKVYLTNLFGISDNIIKRTTRG